MKVSRLLNDLLYSHLIASYIVGIFCVWLAAGWSPIKVVEDAFPLFLSPVVLPLLILMCVETVAQGVAAGACYLVILSITCLLLARLRRRRDESWIKQLPVTPLAATVALDYFSFAPAPAEPFSKLDITAALATIATVATLMFYFAEAVKGGASAFPGVSFYLMCVPMLAAIMIGFASALRTKPYTLPRRVAVIALCVGLFALGLILFTRIPD
jgi:hypothetical protein